MRRLKDLFLRNASLKVLSFFFAVSLWLFVNLKATAEKTLQVPVRRQNQPEILEITNAVADTVRVQVTGPRRILSNLDSGMIPVVLDLSDAKVGLSNYQINEKMLPLPPGLSAQVLPPDTIQFKFELIVEREVQVQVQQVGSPPEGYSLEAIESSPSRIKIVGAQSEVQNLYKMETEPIDLTGHRTSFEVKTKIALSRPHVRVSAGHEQVVAKVRIAERTLRRVLREKQVVLGNAPGGSISIQPPSVEIILEGPAGLIQEIVPEQVTARVSLPGDKALVHRLPVTVEVPVQGIRAESNPDQVVVKISPGHPKP